jgi:hypothetical protein
MARYIEELSRFEDPVLRFFAYAAMAEGAGLDSPVPSQTVMAFWWKAAKILTEELHGPTTLWPIRQSGVSASP